MIILKHVTVERFRLLREIDLHFPQRGSILIQGPNEAGKSALVESIYFALYGESLAFEQGKRSLDELISYGATNAVVTLTLSVGATEMTITRTIERGKEQRVVLCVHRLGMPEDEQITQLDTANERIIAEMDNMDGDTLRNSCLLEQKGLGRLEQLQGSKREVALHKLLGMEKLTRLSEQFQVTPHDEQLLKDATERVHLAEIHTRIPEISQQLDTIEAALDAVTVAEDLAEANQQETEIAEQELSLEQIQAQRSELKVRQIRIQQLKKADTTLAEITGAYDRIAEANSELPALEAQIAELERREREELPDLEKRVSDLIELTKLFNTLQRMSNDLLSSVDMIKELEQEWKHQGETQSDLAELNELVEHTQRRLLQAQEALRNFEEGHGERRLQLEVRLQAMKTITERLETLHQLEQQYTQHLKDKQNVVESDEVLRKTERELQDSEQELAEVEAEAKQVQQELEMLEKRVRQFNVRHHLEEWQRLKVPTQELTEAEQQVRTAHEEQAQFTQAVLEARRTATRNMGIVVSCAILFIVCTITAFVEGLQHQVSFAVLLAIGAILLAGVAIFFFKKYSIAREEEKIADRQTQEAMSKVGMMVAAREAATKLGGNHDALKQVEHELHTLTGTIPRSVEEAQTLLSQTPEQDESITDLEQHRNRKRDEANAAYDQVNLKMEAVARLRKEYTQIEELRAQEQTIEEQLQEDQGAIGRLHQEITLLAGQEGLPQPSINQRLQHSGPLPALSTLSLDNSEDGAEVAGVPELEQLVEGTIKATEYELAILDSKGNMQPELAAQVKIQQQALDVLLTRKRVIEERYISYQTNSPEKQIEQAREQQMGLRTALQSLQESLRQRVKLLGVAFGQTAISGAEIEARKQLEQLQVVLGNKHSLQVQQMAYTTLLKDHQELLAEHYKELAKLSHSLGSWIMPPKPFAEDLAALRTRCQQEIQDANEDAILSDLERLQQQEAASRAKIALCQQEVEAAHERIATMLAQRNRPTTKEYTFTEIVAVWPLLSEYSAQDRSRLENELAASEQELAVLEQQEMMLSTQLHADSVPLDLTAARARLEQQDRSYQVKKRGNLLLKTVNDRLLSKIVPHTEYYVQQLLPLLSSGRYHDVRLSTEEEAGTVSGGPFSLQVWDPAAGEYVHKSALSGGAADQLSLVLRLAFAIAALPRDLNAAPGFIILDEPLSSFDRGRTQALMDVVTGEMLSQHFEQILLISQSNAFDPALFPYHIYMDNGVIVESNLPAVTPTTPVTTLIPPTPQSQAQPLAAVKREHNAKIQVEDADEQEHTILRMPVAPIRLNGK